VQQEEPTLEQRVLILEQKLAELARIADLAGGKIDVSLLISALMARTDKFIDDLEEVRKGQAKILDLVATGRRETASELGDLTRRFDSLEQGFDKLLAIQGGYKEAIERIDTEVADLKDLKEGYKVLQAGQEQIIAILTGKRPRND